MMKILQATPVFKPMWESGGVARVAYDLSLNLLNRGHEVTVYTTNRSVNPTGAPTNRPVKMDGMTVYYFENLRKYFPWKLLPILPYYLPFVAREDLAAYDIVHIHDHRTLLAVAVASYARKFGIPYIVEAHGSLPVSSGSKGFKTVFDHLWKETILENAAGVIALNATEADEYAKAGVAPERIFILPNGIDPAEYAAIPAPGTFRTKYGIAPSERVVLFVGRLARSKGIDLLLRAFAVARNEMPELRLVLVGGNMDYGDGLERLAQELGIGDAVLFTGFVDTEEKMAAYRDANVFVTPSFTGFPITFLESCLCGTPIVTTDKDDVLDWIDGEVGYTVAYDADEMAAAILCILKDDALRRQLGERAQMLVQKRFSWDAVVRELEALYEGCCRDRVATGSANPISIN
jgi:glycosyltransferase involved in cell wall biosynthesis